MPVFDFIALARIVIRVSFALALIAYVLSLANLIGDVILNAWQLVTSNMDNVLGALNNGDSALSCTYYIIHALGIDVTISSFIAAIISIFVMWGSVMTHLLLITYSVRLKGMFLEVLK